MNKKTKKPNASIIEIAKCDEEENNSMKPKSWSIIKAMDKLLDLARDSELSDQFWETSKSPLAFLTKKLGMTKMQVIVIAILVESGEPLSWRGIGEFLGCSRLSIMAYTEEIEELLEKRWMVRRCARDRGRLFEGFALVHGVVTALRHNKPFVPEKIDNLDINDFLYHMESYVDKYVDNVPMVVDFADAEELMVNLCKANPQLPLCQEVMRFNDDIHIQSLFLLTVVDYAQFAESCDEGLTLSYIDHLYPHDFEVDGMRMKLRKGTHPLIASGLIEQKCEEGMANTERYALTSKCKEQLLNGYTPSKSKCQINTKNDKHLKSCASIKQKDMFYNPCEQEQINRLANLLNQENLSSVQERLEKEGMRKGFACLFYGAPGTGKTETVLQIARQTGRDIMQIDIAGMRDKFVGESEKNIKAVFRRYRNICKRQEVMPILFFNEADGILGKRTEFGPNPSVEKMENAMQNIILQELEDLEGILIATTNLTCNLDTAFERRFIFKVEFSKPDTEVKTKLWRSMLGDGITEDDAMRLAQKYDFSGGQIENIARKRTIEYVLSGKNATFDDLVGFCEAELIGDQSGRRSIGFAS